MNSLILRSAALVMMPLLLLFSVFLLIRGHNDPGGGFAGGLVAASAFALYALATDVASARRTLGVDAHVLIAVGLLLAVSSGLPGLFTGGPFMTDQWGKIALPGVGVLELGTPLVFDAGVYLVVFGVTLMIILSLAEE
jgi:multicomponent Na+:H+ antiporter subunit B